MYYIHIYIRSSSSSSSSASRISPPKAPLPKPSSRSPPPKAPFPNLPPEVPLVQFPFERSFSQSARRGDPSTGEFPDRPTCRQSLPAPPPPPSLGPLPPCVPRAPVSGAPRVGDPTVTLSGGAPPGGTAGGGNGAGSSRYVPSTSPHAFYVFRSPFYIHDYALHSTLCALHVNVSARVPRRVHSTSLPGCWARRGMYVCVYMCAYTWVWSVCAYLYVYQTDLYTYVCVYTYIYMCVYVYVHTYVCMCV